MAAGLMIAAASLAGCAGPAETPAASPSPGVSGSPATPGFRNTPTVPAALPEPGSATAATGSAAWGGLAAVAGPDARLVLLGDSFASGEGGGGYLPVDGVPQSLCHRSAYPLLAAYYPPEQTFNLACSRARIEHLRQAQRVDDAHPNGVAAQLEQLGGLRASLVLVSLGGNDIDFSRLLQACLLEETDCSRDGELAAGTGALLAAAEKSLEQAYRDIGSAVTAPVLVLPYPQLFDAPAAASCGPLSPDEQRYGRRLVTELNAGIRRAVAAADRPNVHYVAPLESALDGRGACSTDPLVHSARLPGLAAAAASVPQSLELLHPTRAGYAAMTAALAGWLKTAQL